jgi:hypothetical protein
MTPSLPPLASVAPAASVAPPPDPPWRTPRRPEQERELSETARTLKALRAVPPGNRLTCAQFRRVELAAGLAARQERGEERVNECSAAAAALLTCFETPTGFFVPFAAVEGICGYRLWFVPRDREREPQPVSEAFEEFDISFTVRFAPDNLDADDEIEALLIRGWAHPEGAGESQDAFAIEPSGEQRRLPFNDMKDVDGDGRHDVVVSFASSMVDPCSPPEPVHSVHLYLQGPELVLRRVAGFKFSLDDDGARRARAASCKDLGDGVVARRGRAVDEQETLRRAVCRLADGEDPQAIQRALEAACQRAPKIPAECRALRPGTCLWRDDLLLVTKRMASLRPWLEIPTTNAAP